MTLRHTRCGSWWQVEANAGGGSTAGTARCTHVLELMFLFGIKSMSSRTHTHIHTEGGRDINTDRHRHAARCVATRCGKQEQDADADAAETGRW